jgi:hypothetical protein
MCLLVGPVWGRIKRKGATEAARPTRRRTMLPVIRELALAALIGITATACGAADASTAPVAPGLCAQHRSAAVQYMTVAAHEVRRAQTAAAAEDHAAITFAIQNAEKAVLAAAELIDRAPQTETALYRVAADLETIERTFGPPYNPNKDYADGYVEVEDVSTAMQRAVDSFASAPPC